MTWAEVDLSAIEDNIKSIRARVGQDIGIMPAVKANAYGHGAVETAAACLRAGADSLCVANVDEAAELRQAGIDSPVLILGCSLPGAARDIVRLNAASTVCDVAFARALSQAACERGITASVHLKVDTGMGRIGVQPEHAIEFARELATLPGIKLEGVFTHFPCSDEPDHAFTLTQIGTMNELRSDFDRLGLPVPMMHASNSGAILALTEGDFDAVRPGIIVYGHYPSPEVVRSIPIREALTLRTRIVFLKTAKAGSTISYGRTHTLRRQSRIATLPVGYADGYNRLLSNKGEAAVHGKRVPVVGRVCMDQILIDVTDVPQAEVGDEVTLYGGGYDYLSVSEIARKIGTIPYEVLCNIGRRVPRIYVQH